MSATLETLALALRQNEARIRALEAKNALLEKKSTALEARGAALEAKNANLDLQLKIREEQLRWYKAQRYGPKGEKLSHAQYLLLNLEPGVQAGEVEKEAALPEKDKALVPPAAAPAAPQRKKRAPYFKGHPGRTPLPAHLKRVEVIIPCLEGAGGKLIGEERTEVLKIKPAEFYVEVLIREKRLVTLGDQATILTAPLPPRIIEKGQFDNSVVVEVLVTKYCDHVPAYRQRLAWERDYGIVLNDSLLIRAILRGGELLCPLAWAIGEELKRGNFIQADETRVPVLQQEGKGKNDTAWFWQYSKPGGLVFFDYQSSRSGAGPGTFLAGYTGLLQSDGYPVYTKAGQNGRGRAGCWAHARRKFMDASKAAPPGAPCAPCLEMAGLIAKLYDVEKEARALSLQGSERLALRVKCEVPEQLKVIQKRLVAIRQDALPQSLLGKACQYALNQWESLILYATDGTIEIDNNWCENAMRPVALGRKNWLHLGSQESGPVVAAILSVIASAERARLNVRVYLADVLGRLANPDFKITQINDLLPQNWRPA